MALAPYFRRSAVAAAQVLSGFDEDAIRRQLHSVTVGIGYADQGGATPEGRFCIEMAVRLLARLYPRLRIQGPENRALIDLAKAINIDIELIDEECDFNLCIGSGAPRGKQNIFLGSDRWDARISPQSDRVSGDSPNPFGAGAAACLGAAYLFRSIFLEDSLDEEDLVLSTLDLENQPSESQLELGAVEIPSSTVLVGLGAIGNAAMWALARAGSAGTIHLVDPESIELSNLQRYLLAECGDENKPKVEFVRRFLNQHLAGNTHQLTWEQFTATEGYKWDRVLVALDSAKDRRAVQDTLPRWIVNGWTQPGDLGVSVHPWREGACLACLYLAKGETPNEDELIASALGLSDQAHQQQIRRLLVGDEPTPRASR